jgi:hypothetical protein
MRALPPALCVLLACPLLFAGGSAETETPAESLPAHTRIIEGTLRLVGNDPFARLVLTSDEGKDYIIDEAAPERKTLQNHQGRRVRMEALVREYPVYAGKKYLGVECLASPVHYDFMPPTEAR